MKSLIEKYWSIIHKEIEDSSPSSHDGLMNGTLGLIWYYYQLAKTKNKQKYAQKTFELLESVFENMNTEPKLAGASLANGVAGFCYVVTHLVQEEFLEIDIDEELADFDQYLYKTALQRAEEGNIDYLHGAFGVVFYFSERLQNPTISAYADVLVKKLISQAIIDEKGWRLVNKFLSNNDDEVNFSLSHGLTSFLIILLNIHQKGLAIDGIKDIFREGVKFIIGYQMDVDLHNERYSNFPFSVNKATDETSVSNMLAWCYGDLNVVLFLYRAAKFLNSEEFKKIADEVGDATTKRLTTATTLVTDSHFCHGSAGVAQCYYRLYEITSKESYKNSFEFWKDKTLLFIENDLKNDTFANKKNELLEGWVGVALTLQTTFAGESANWDAPFLL